MASRRPSVLRTRRLGAIALFLGSVLQPVFVSAQTETSRRMVADGFTFAASGDMIGPYQPVMTRGSTAIDSIAAILRGADVAFANLEGNVFNRHTFPATWAAENGGGHPLFEVGVAADYKALGLDMVSRANNHAIDYGIGGMLETSRVLDAAGIVYAGAGANGIAARAPAYLSTPKGRIALVSAASTFPPMAAAGEAGSDTEARPGINALRIQQILLVTPAEMEVVHRIAARQDWEGTPVFDPKQQYVGGQQQIGGTVFSVSDTPGQTWEVNETDRQAILASIAEARRNADFVVFTIHAHERLPTGRPADFLQPLFHDAIDAGADVVVRHGPHYLEGIEIYKGRPIFYDMGSLFTPLGTERFTGDSPSGTPSARLIFDVPPEWNDGAIAVSEFRNGQVSEIRLYPHVIDYTPEMYGTPRPATPEEARRILERFQMNCAPYGMQIQIENNVGIIRVSSRAN